MVTSSENKNIPGISVRKSRFAIILLFLGIFAVFGSCSSQVDEWYIKSEVEKETVQVGEQFVYLVRVLNKGSTELPEVIFPDLPPEIKRIGQTRKDQTKRERDEKTGELYIRTLLVGVSPGRITIPPVTGKLNGMAKQTSEHVIEIVESH